MGGFKGDDDVRMGGFKVAEEATTTMGGPPGLASTWSPVPVDHQSAEYSHQKLPPPESNKEEKITTKTTD